jgi:hypothetical protein
MPELSRFYGIIVRVFYDDHPPAHFHAVHQGEQAQIDIDTLEVVKGHMRRRALAMVLEWASLHREELRRAWNLASQNQEPPRIEPLE